MTVFNYVRRGLFERDKLTVATMLTLKILVNDGLLAQEDVDYLVMSKVRTLGVFPSFDGVLCRSPKHYLCHMNIQPRQLTKTEHVPD